MEEAMNKTILFEIENAKKIYSLVLKEIRKFGLKEAGKSTADFLNDNLQYLLHNV
jgi:hypothetical protein